MNNMTTKEMAQNNEICFTATIDKKKAEWLMAQLMKLCQQYLSCLRRCFCFSN